MSKLETWIFSILVAIVVCVAIFVIKDLVSAAAQVAAAVVAVVGGIMAAVAKHGFDLERERRHAEFLAKQKHYAELLATIGNFARKKENSFDALCSAHLASWAFGDFNVLKATNALMEKPESATLVALLAAMRDSLGEKGDSTSMAFKEKLSAAGYKTELLFGPRTGEGFK